MDVGTSSNDSLNRIEIADDEMNPFVGKSNAEICCYRIQVDSEGHISSLSPYIDSREIHRYSHIGKDNKKVDGRVDEVESSVDETNATVDMLLTDVTPDMMGTLEENKATIDMILTEILPMLMGDE